MSDFELAFGIPPHLDRIEIFRCKDIKCFLRYHEIEFQNHMRKLMQAKVAVESRWTNS